MHGRERSLLYTCFKEAYKRGNIRNGTRTWGKISGKRSVDRLPKQDRVKKRTSRFRHIYRPLGPIQKARRLLLKGLTTQKAWQALPSLPCNYSLRRTGPGNRILKTLPCRALFYLDAYLTPSRTLPRTARRTDADSTHITSTASLSR